ncbi:MAG: TSUP family transporter, partial [Bacteroidota bacterium]
LFGLPAMIAAFAGAWLLGKLSTNEITIPYQLAGKQMETSMINLVIAALLTLFAVFELNKRLANFTLGKKFLPFGGILSGFFGGMSGHQGALRSMFLLKAGLTKEGFIATGISIAILIDISRLTVYGSSFLFQKLQTINSEQSTAFVVVACLSAFIGSFLGKRLLKKVTIRNVQIIVSVMLLIFAVLLGSGII